MRSVLSCPALVKFRAKQALASCIQDVGLSLNKQLYQLTTMPSLFTFCKLPRCFLEEL